MGEDLKMKKLFLFIGVFILLASGCVTQQRALFSKPDVTINQPLTKVDINDFVRRLEALEKRHKQFTLEDIKRLAAKTGATNFFGAITLTGGTSGALDDIDGDDLANGDICYAVTSTDFYVYYLNATSGAGESSPDIISPDDNAGNKRWELIFLGDAEMADMAQLAVTDGNFIVGNGTTWVAESGDIARISLGVGTTDSPTFVTAKLSGLGDGLIPYHVDDATGLADSPLSTDGTDVTATDDIFASAFDTNVAAAGVTLSGTTLAADGTDAHIDISITPKGTGEVNLTKVDIDAGAIDGTAIGGSTPAAGAFTTIGATGNVTPDLLTASKPVFTDASKNLVSTGTLAVDQGGTGATTAAAAFTALKQAATVSATGVVELATNAEVALFTDTVKAVTPSSLGFVMDSLLAYGVQWDEDDSSPTLTRLGALANSASAASPGNALLPIQSQMRRCILSDAGVVQYYLCATDSTDKADCVTASVLDGTDGQVMVEIPKFAYKYSYDAALNIHQWWISPTLMPGYEWHPAFYKDGSWVDHRYIGAYEGILYDTSESKYVNGLYLAASATYTVSFLDNGGSDDTITSDVLTHPFSKLVAGVDTIVISGSAANDGTYAIQSVTDTVITLATGTLSATTANDQCILQVQRDWTASSGDVLGSVSGFGSMNYGTRGEFREVALNRGAGWRQQDYYLSSALQLLYLVEYASFYSQSMIGAGLTDWASAWPAWNNYNPINFTGLTNSLGNATGNLSNGNGAVGSYMSYRGIENFYGHLWKWVDGFNINDNIPYVSNTETDFADGTDSNYTRLTDTGGSGITLYNGNDYQSTLEQTKGGFLPSAGGGATNTYITDYYYQASGWRVARLGGSAYSGSLAGFFCWALNYASGDRDSHISGRVAY